jgi:hypothetical protein
MYQRRVMATQFVQSEELPNLLDMSGSPPTKRAMQFWRYVHRWRQRLFQRWGEAQSPELAPGLRGQLVDHLIGLGLILGVDIDDLAVAWARRLLLLAVWEASSCDPRPVESSQSLAIPDLRANILCGSFLDPGVLGGHGRDSTVDVVVGGPPFVRLQELHRSQRQQIATYKRLFRSARRGQFDLYMLFIEQALK